MEKTLIIYDLNGTIIGSPITGFYNVPNGIPYLEVEVPSGKYIVSVNMETKEVIYEDIPRTQVELLEDKISILEAQNKDLEDALVELASMVGGA